MPESTDHQDGKFQAVLRRIGLANESGLRLERCIPVLAGLCWLPLLALTAIDGTAWGQSVDIAFLEDLGGYGRFLIGLPLLLIGERVASMELAAVSEHFREADLVRKSEEATADSYRNRLRSRIASGPVELLLLLLAFALPWFSMAHVRGALDEAGFTMWAFEPGGGLTAAGWWYVVVAIPLFSFIALRWIWRFIAWSLFLRSMAKLDLQLKPAHPDRMGGLDPVVVAQSSFTTFLLVGSVLLAALMGNDILHSGRSITTLYPEIGAWIGLSLVVLLGPLLVFFPALRRARVLGSLDYGKLGDSLTETFAERWKDKDASGMIDTGDPSAVADFGAVYGTVTTMRTVPFGLKQLIGIGIVLLVPFFPLLLTAMSLKQLLSHLMGLVM